MLIEELEMLEARDGMDGPGNLTPTALRRVDSLRLAQVKLFKSPKRPHHGMCLREGRARDGEGEVEDVGGDSEA